jgi:diguanylate cyclase (GGDEF)-like protein
MEHEQLQKLAALDPLTGVLNRRFGMVRLHEEYSRSVRRGAPLAVLMFDIDHFKQVNDTYGHVVGDRVLRNISGMIRQGIREGDILLRYGGEEFMVILPGASRDDAFAIAERVRHIVRENATTYGANQICVTISVGLDSMPETSINNEQELIANADGALYQSKNAGRDRTTIHS